MALTPGSRVGPYEVTALLGEGGMGQVYRGTDTNLKRQVALKVLPDSVAGNAERLARFQREAEVLAALNHPHIAAIYGLEKSGGITALVMELVEGDDLSQRIARGAIPIDDALPIATQIAEALEAAHEQGVIHRDLKPANIKVRTDGTVKVLDFGLAKALDPAAASSPEAMNSPTITSPAITHAGVILGTAAYMAPEQARGKAVDRRADIWAFGAVLYEMLTGARAFDGEDVADTLGNVMKVDPDWQRLPASTPPRAAWVLRACLQKNPKQRLDSAQGVRLALDGAFEIAGSPPALPVIPDRRRHLAALAAAALVGAAVAGAAAWVAMGRAASPASEARLYLTRSGSSVGIAISPDGRRVAFSSTTDGQGPLLVRALDNEVPQALAGTDGAVFPFWSPDSGSLGFFAQGKLKRVDIAAGLVQVLADASSNPRGGTWSRDGVILFAPSAVGPIYQVSAAGGPATVLTRLEKPAQSDHRAPQFLPDGRHFLYYARGTSEGRGVYVGGLDGSHSPRLVDADAGAVYASNGHLLFVRAGTLFAVRFDLDRLALVGNPFPVAQQVVVFEAISMAALSASEAGPIIYRAGATVQQQLVWADRSGTRVEPVGEADSPLNGPALSPDGREIVVGRNIDGNWDLWLIDIVRGVRRRFTSDPAIESSGVWSPDGREIAFRSARTGGGLVTKAVSGTEPERVLQQSGQPSDWSPDGRFLLYEGTTPETGLDISALAVAGGTSIPVAHSRFTERDGQFSPDGRWVAYASDESGRSEIYVQPFPGPGEKTQVSTAGGAQVRWRRDGKELFYVALDAQLMAVPMQLPQSGSTIGAGRPVALFATHIGGALLPIRTQYAVGGVGDRFLMSTRPEDTLPISVILNWAPKP